MSQLQSKKNAKEEKKNMVSNLSQSLNPIIRQLNNNQNALEMPELALKCAQYFHSLSKYCMNYYHNYQKDEEAKKTKFIKKQEKDKNQKRTRKNRKKQDNNDGEADNNEQHLQPPKKPLTAYIIYFQDKKPQFVERYPSLSLSQLTRLIAKQWKQLTQAEKQVYLDRASDDRKRYDEQLAQFKRMYGQNVSLKLEIEVKNQNKPIQEQLEAFLQANEIQISSKNEANMKVDSKDQQSQKNNQNEQGEDNDEDIHEQGQDEQEQIVEKDSDEQDQQGDDSQEQNEMDIQKQEINE